MTLPASPSQPQDWSQLALVAERLHVTRGTRSVLSDLSFRVGPGEALLLTGPNGSGKSTLLRALAGFLPPAIGRIALTGTDDDVPRAQCAHVCGHLDGIKAQLTVVENLEFWADYLGNVANPPQAVTAALTHFRLDSLAATPAAYLSAGQKRRLGLARLLVAERPLWLLDEPTVSLDSASIELLLAAARAHLQRSGIIVAATHLDLPLPKARELRLGGSATQPASAGAAP